MILEAIGLKKQAYFINPLGDENPFFENLEYLNSNLITNYDDLETKITDVKNKKCEIMNDKICVNGKASELIIEIVDNILKEKNK